VVSQQIIHLKAQMNSFLKYVKAMVCEGLVLSIFFGIAFALKARYGYGMRVRLMNFLVIGLDS
jgi:hypothetical protein